MNQKPGGGTNSISVNGTPEPGEPVCVGCLLKAIAEGRSIVRFGG